MKKIFLVMFTFLLLSSHSFSKMGDHMLYSPRREFVFLVSSRRFDRNKLENSGYFTYLGKAINVYWSSSTFAIGYYKEYGGLKKMDVKYDTFYVEEGEGDFLIFVSTDAKGRKTYVCSRETYYGDEIPGLKLHKRGR